MFILGLAHSRWGVLTEGGRLVSLSFYCQCSGMPTHLCHYGKGSSSWNPVLSGVQGLVLWGTCTMGWPNQSYHENQTSGLMDSMTAAMMGGPQLTLLQLARLTCICLLSLQLMVSCVTGLELDDSPLRRRWTTRQRNASSRSADSEK